MALKEGLPGCPHSLFENPRPLYAAPQRGQASAGEARGAKNN